MYKRQGIRSLLPPLPQPEVPMTSVITLPREAITPSGSGQSPNMKEGQGIGPIIQRKTHLRNGKQGIMPPGPGSLTGTAGGTAIVTVITRPTAGRRLTMPGIISIRTDMR